VEADRPSTFSVLTRPRMVALHLLALAAIATMVLAGRWQVGVYAAAQEDVGVVPATEPATSLEQVMGPDDAFPAAGVSSPVQVRGTYADEGQQFLVSGREEGGREGFWVLTPLLVADVTAADGRPTAILVVRGWQEGDTVPDVPTGPVRVTGVLQPGEQGATSVGEDRVVEAVRIPALVAAVPFDLYSAFLIRTSEAPPADDDLVPVSQSAPDVSWTEGLRNLAYGLQWWLFAGFTAFMWWRIARDEVTTVHGAARPVR